MISRRIEDQYLGCMNKKDNKSSARVKAKIDPSCEEFNNLLSTLMKNRTSGKKSHVLFHYNGHGVPLPTEKGDLFLLEKDNNMMRYKEYPAQKIRQTLTCPTMFVLDCSRAELLISHLCPESTPQILPACTFDTLILASCSRNDLLPSCEGLPYDIFTACLTTPLKVAVRFFQIKNAFHMRNKERNLYDEIQGTIVYIYYFYRLIKILHLVI